MPDEKQDAQTMVKWKTPDGVELDVPEERLKELEGLNERFTGLSQKEQALADKDKKLEADHEQRVKDANADWLDGMDADELKAFGKERFPDEFKEKAPPKTGDEEFDAKAAIEKLTADQAARDEAAKQAADDAEFQDAVGKVEQELLTVAEADEAFRNLPKSVQDRILGTAFGATQDSNYEMPAKDALALGMTAEVEYLTAYTEHLAQEKQKANAPVPGEGTGEVQVPDKKVESAEDAAKWALDRHRARTGA